MGMDLINTDKMEQSAEQAEDHLSTDVTTQMIPALIKALTDMAAKKKVTVTITLLVEDR